MNTLFVFAAHNTAAALVLAVLVYGVTRAWRNPAVAHVLWFLVLLRLVAAPVLHINWPAFWLPGPMQAAIPTIPDEQRIKAPRAESQPRFADRAAARPTAGEPTARVTEHGSFKSRRSFWDAGWSVLFWLWLGGAILCAAVAVTRIVRFERRLREMLPASERL